MNQQVTAHAESRNTAMLLEPTEGTGPVLQLGPSQMGRAGWQELTGERTTINGLDAYVGTYADVSNGARYLIQAAHVRSGPQTFVTAGIATSRAFEAVRGTFDAAIRSFRALSRAEADAIHPNRVDFYVVKPGDTWESIARTAGENMVKPATLAIMNGGVPASPSRTGDRVRIVVGG